jgi:hypothetical protein
MTDSTSNQDSTIINKLRVQFIFKNSSRKWYRFKNPKYPVQSEPFKYGIKVTNIGNNVFAGADIEDFTVHMSTANSSFKCSSQTHVKSLNPNESVELYLDKHTCVHSGATWIKCKFIPSKEDVVIKTHQYDENHQVDEPYVEEGAWGESSFIQGQLELLQANTNIQILTLTCITVLEAIFGLKNILSKVFSTLSTLLVNLGELLGYLA